jgi:peptide/nickel transport system substrate-binding protein
MQTRLIKLRFRRRLRKGQKQVEELGSQAEKQIEENFLGRFDRLRPVRRFVIAWLGLMALLIAALVGQNLNLGSYYQSLRGVPGGIYNEGILGRFTNANPIYATSDADASVSRLIFSGLFNYDQNGKLVGDLARSYSVDEHGSTYTVHLKPNLTWQDGQPLTSADVVYTYQLIQNPDVQSPLQSGWQGIEVSATDAYTIVFKLPGGLAAFPYNMTNGIVPKHILESIKPIDMRSADFNTVKPVGAGPFKWQAIQVKGDGTPEHAQERIALQPFKNYQAGQPKLQKFVTYIYADKTQMTGAFANNQLTAIEGLTDEPANLRHKSGMLEHNIPLRAATMVFFKTSAGVLANTSVRQALVKGADVPQIIDRLSYPARKVREPILIGQVGYDPALTEPGHDLKGAKALLDGAGWKLGKDGIRSKDGHKLTFTLTTADTADYHLVTKELKRQWLQLGVDLNVQYLDSNEFQTALTSHGYDAVLYGISIGPDPDVFVYWDSSQADIRSANRLNLSEYKNPTADASLEAGRTRSDPALRVIKYKPFLQEWQKDAPALGLYQPRLLYLTNGPVAGLNDNLPITSPIERFNNVNNWEIREAKVTN